LQQLLLLLLLLMLLALEADGTLRLYSLQPHALVRGTWLTLNPYPSRWLNLPLLRTGQHPLQLCLSATHLVQTNYIPAGSTLLLPCVQADIPCSYAFLSGISYTMREVSKVMLGAAAVLSNGTVLGRAGSAAVAMCAAASSKVRLVHVWMCVHCVPA
jgi:hypothetical protein